MIQLGVSNIVSSYDRFLRDRRMFTVHCENIVRAAARKTTPASPEVEGVVPHTLTARIASMFSAGSSQPAFLGSPHGSSPSGASNTEGQRSPRRLRPDMIRRIDDAPRLVNPSGWISEGQAGPTNGVRPTSQSDNRELSPSTALHDPQLHLTQERRSTSSMRSVSPGQSRVGRPLKRHS
jgi:hypothetical protein